MRIKCVLCVSWGSITFKLRIFFSSSVMLVVIALILTIRKSLECCSPFMSFCLHHQFSFTLFAHIPNLSCLSPSHCTRIYHPSPDPPALTYSFALYLASTDNRFSQCLQLIGRVKDEANKTKNKSTTTTTTNTQ